MPNDYPDWTHAIIFFPQSGSPVSPADIPDWTTAAISTGVGISVFSTGYVGAPILLAASVEATVPFDQVDLDDLGVLTAGGQMTVTAASEGWWLLQAGVTFQDAGVGPNPRIYYSKIRYVSRADYVTTDQLISPFVTGTGHDTACQRVIGLFAGDVLDVRAYCNQAGSSVDNQWQRTYFQGIFLGGYTR